MIVANKIRVSTLRIDPTRTGVLRRRFKRDLRARFLLLRREVLAYFRDDVLDLRPIANSILGSIRDRLDKFGDWVKSRAETLLDRGLGALIDAYVREVVRKGIDRAHEEVRPELPKIGPVPPAPAKGQFVGIVDHSPEADRVREQVATRIEMDINGAVGTSIINIGRRVIDGIERGQTPQEIARMVVIELDKSGAIVDGIVDDGAVRGHADGQLLGFSALGVEQVGASVEWRTAGDLRVCKLCSSLGGMTFTLEKAKGMMPRHPRCRCAWVPARPRLRSDQAVVANSTQSRDSLGRFSSTPHAGASPIWSSPPHWKSRAYGAVVHDGKGNILLRAPMNNFDGYHWTFPKGKLDSAGEHPHTAALRETLEETGHKVSIEGHVPGGHIGGTSTSYFYLAKSEGKTQEHDSETYKTRWVTLEKAKELIGRSTNPTGRRRDMAILEAASRMIPRPTANQARVPAGSSAGGEFTSGDKQSVSAADLTTKLHPDHSLSGGRLFEAFIGGKKVGDLKVIDKSAGPGDWNSGVVRTEQLGVEQKFRGMGVAKEMYKKLFEQLKLEGVKKVISGGTQSAGGTGVWKSLAKDLPVHTDGKSFSIDLTANVGFCEEMAPLVNMSPTQPRDEDGKWIAVWHVTPTERISSIKEKGIVKPEADAVYTAKSLEGALAFGRVHYPGKDLSSIRMEQKISKDHNHGTVQVDRTIHPTEFLEIQRHGIPKEDRMTGEIKWTFNPLVNMAPNQARDYHGRFAAVPGSGGMAMSQEGKMVSKSTTRAGTIPAPHDVTVLSKLGGSTGAKLVVDKAGRKWVMKTGPGPEQLRNEVSADNAYRALGIRTPASGLHVDPHSGVVTKFSRYIEGGQTLHDWEKGKTPNEVSAMHAKVGKGFVADALLANWDAIGMHKDNILIKDGKPLRIDNGGALAYRAQGAPKGTAFGTSVTEVTSLQNSTKNPSAASVYGHIKFGDMDSQVSAIVGRKAQLLESIADPKTRATVEARLTDLVNKFGTTVVNPYTPPPTLAPLPTSSPKPTGQSTTGKQLKELIKGKMKGKDVGLKPNHLFLIENMNPDGAKNGELKIPKGLSPEGVKFLSDSLPHGMKLVAAQSGDSAAAHKLASDKAKEKKLGGATPDSSPLTKPSGVASLKKSPLVKPSSLSDSTAAFPTFFSHTGPTVDTSGKAMTQSQVNEFGKPHEQFAAEFESKWSVSRGLSKEETSETKAFLKETTTHLIGLADPYIKSLSKSTKSGIGDYTASKYIKINSDMRQCPPKFECLQGSSKSISRAIVKAIENSPPLGTPVRCTRGIDLNPMEVVSIMRHAREAAKVGGVYQMPSITSSSVDGMPRLGNDVIFKILAKKGLYVDHVSSTQGEKEMLLSPNSKYRVVKITSEVSGKYSALLKPHIYMEEIS